MNVLIKTLGGSLCVPEYPMIDRADGGNLWVMPPREVWDRSELDREELIQWHFLIAASAKAMLDALPQLGGGVVNYWDAGNWWLNDAEAPQGPKTGCLKKTHMHIIGRSLNCSDPDWAWGEAPVFPRYVKKDEWWSEKENLTLEERSNVAKQTREILITTYAIEPDTIDVL